MKFSDICYNVFIYIGKFSDICDNLSGGGGNISDVTLFDELDRE